MKRILVSTLVLAAMLVTGCRASPQQIGSSMATAQATGGTAVAAEDARQERAMASARAR